MTLSCSNNSSAVCCVPLLVAPSSPLQPKTPGETKKHLAGGPAYSAVKQRAALLWPRQAGCKGYVASARSQERDSVGLTGSKGGLIAQRRMRSPKIEWFTDRGPRPK
ncbi:hypothetical protein GQ53DRAFT_754818 [Thozetella sp. PMI_491]|nr:hypothetical protein GQ53DRAFT_754818 [Thozetella sp. PMI_491]